MLYDPDDLRADVTSAGLDIRHLAVEEVALAEGSGHNGTASVARLLAVKPAD